MKNRLLSFVSIALVGMLLSSCSGGTAPLDAADSGATQPEGPPVSDISADDLSVTQVTDADLEYINGEPWTFWYPRSSSDMSTIIDYTDPAQSASAASEASAAATTSAKNDEVMNPEECRDALLVVGRPSDSHRARIDSKAKAFSSKLSDVLNGSGPLLHWASTADLTTPAIATAEVDNAAAMWPKCQAAMFGTKDDPISAAGILVERQGPAVVTVEAKGDVNILEPIGSVIYSASMTPRKSWDASALSRGAEVYNKLANALAAAQGVTRTPVSLDNVPERIILAEAAPKAPAFVKGTYNPICGAVSEESKYLAGTWEGYLSKDSGTDRIAFTEDCQVEDEGGYAEGEWRQRGGKVEFVFVFDLSDKVANLYKGDLNEAGTVLTGSSENGVFQLKRVG